MGASSDGITAIGDYSGAATGGDAVDILLALIPDPDAAHGTGAVGGGGQGGLNTYLDEMSPAAAVQIRAELLAMKDQIDAFA